MSCEYASISLFLESKQTLIDRVNAIDALVDVMGGHYRELQENYFPTLQPGPTG